VGLMLDAMKKNCIAIKVTTLNANAAKNRV